MYPSANRIQGWAFAFIYQLLFYGIIKRNFSVQASFKIDSAKNHFTDVGKMVFSMIFYRAIFTRLSVCSKYIITQKNHYTSGFCLPLDNNGRQ